MTKTTKAERPAVMPAGDAGVMGEFSRLRTVLETTHSQIPQLLARERAVSHELGLTETEALRNQLADVTREREAAVRRRMSAVGALTELEGPLQAERLALEAQRQAYAAEAVRAFEARYAAAVSELQACWETGRALGMALRCEVRMPLPVTLRESPVDGVSRAMPVRADVAGVVDAEAAKLGAKLDLVDGALAMVAAIRQSALFDQQSHRLGLLRNTAQPASGVYRVLQPFRNLVDGLEFQPGQLVDSSLIGSSMMSRLQVGRRHIEPVGLQTSAAA